MGVAKETVRPGKGAKPKVGDRVTMHYICRLAQTGKIVDSSRLKGRAAEFQVGTGRVIQGWDEGVVEMQEGEEAILKVSSDYAYGTSGRPPSIPPNADLDFSCELLAINESMVAAAMRVKSERIALEQEDEMIRQARADARREAGGAEGPALPGAEGDAPDDEARTGKKKRRREKSHKRKREASERKHKKGKTSRARSSSDETSSSSSPSDSSSSSAGGKRHEKSSKKKHRRREKHGSKKQKDKKRPMR
ncbi:hypothetical protein KFE25_006863 [Diacronema lutheri]|uniref:peptidylprolyl isomerase n=1 Tax=Diacronema lutheri TaxID=2081491 RepID=A0A8J6CE56_DIALT|nr:hypothetical protein KFE25_006863 [Diacronema lutheri]